MLITSAQQAPSSEPTIAIPITYFHTLEGEIAHMHRMQETLLQVPISKALVYGLRYKVKDIILRALQQNALDYIESDELFKAFTFLNQYLNNEPIGRRIGLNILALVVTLPPLVASTTNYFDNALYNGNHLLSIRNLFSTHGLGVCASLVWAAVLHGTIERYARKKDRENLGLVGMLLKHKMFSHPKHVAITPMMRELLLKKYSKETLRKALQEVEQLTDNNPTPADIK